MSPSASQKLKILLIEDDPAGASLIQEYLAATKENDLAVECVNRLSAGLERLAQGGIDAIVLDLSLADSQELDTFRIIRAHVPQAPVFVLSGQSELPLALRAVKEGARDYLLKGQIHGAELVRSLRYEVERKRAEDKSRAKEQQLRLALAAGNMGTWDWHLASGSVHWSASLERIHGFAPGTFGGKPEDLMRTVHPDDRERINRTIAETIAHDIEYRAEYRIVLPLGSLRWLESRGQVIRDDMGKGVRMLGVSMDITERKKAELALKESEQRYKQMLESVTDYIYTVRIETGAPVATVHGAGCVRVTGYTPAEFQADAFLWHRMIHDEDRPTVAAHLARVLAGELLPPLEHRIWHKSGAVRWIRNILRLGSGAGEGITLYDGLISDVTERKSADEALKQSEAHYYSLVENVPLHVFRKDRSGRFTYANRRFCASLDRPLGQIIGKTDYDFYPSHLADKYRADDQRVMNVGEIFEDTEKNQSASMEATYVMVIKVPVYDADKNIAGIQGMFWDVTATWWAKEQKAQLHVARAIQQKLLPTRAPKLANYDIAGASYPAEATGGDYFDFIDLSDGSAAIVIGDVSGHGFGPALLAAVTHACLRTLTLTRAPLPIDLLLSAANRLLQEDTGGEQFVTLMFARLDPKNLSLLYSSAGHPPGFIMNTQGAIKMLLSETSPLLGVFAEAEFLVAPAITLEPGDLILLLTDGIPDALAPDGTFFGQERALQVVREHRHFSAQEIVEALCRAARNYYGQTPQRDDITAVVIKVTGGP